MGVPHSIVWHLLRSGDVLLGDRKYCSYADIALLRASGVDVVARLGKRKTDFRCGLILGVQDHLRIWRRPKQLPAWLRKQTLPEEISVRELRFCIDVPGFRVSTVTLVTTLTD